MDVLIVMGGCPPRVIRDRTLMTRGRWTELGEASGDQEDVLIGVSRGRPSNSGIARADHRHLGAVESLASNREAHVSLSHLEAILHTSRERFPNMGFLCFSICPAP